MKFPKTCPGCNRPIAEVTGPEQTALRGTIRYKCGTVFGLYDAMVQVSNPCVKMPQWNSVEGFEDMLRLRRLLRELAHTLWQQECVYAGIFDEEEAVAYILKELETNGQV